MPCVIVQSPVTSSSIAHPHFSSPEQGSDHILNLSASMNKHFPLSPLSKKSVEKTSRQKETGVVDKGDNCKLNKVDNHTRLKLSTISPNPLTTVNSGSKCDENLDMNSNQVKRKENEMSVRVSTEAEGMECVSDVSSENDMSDDEKLTEIDVDDSMTHVDDLECTTDSESETEASLGLQNDSAQKREQNNRKVLTFGIDRILSNSRDHKGIKFYLILSLDSSVYYVHLKFNELQITVLNKR